MKNHREGRRLKISIIGTRGYPSFYGGFETAVRHIAPRFADNGMDVSVYGRKNSILENWAGRDERIQSVLTTGFDTKIWSTLSYGLTSVLHVALRKHDVVLIMNVANGFWLPILKILKVPTAVNVDGIEWERQKWSKAAKVVFKIGAWFTAKFADEIICDSKHIAEYWNLSFGRRGVYIPYGGVIPSASMRLPQGLKPKEYVLVVSRFVPENTIAEFLSAADQLAKKYKVVLVGSSGYGSSFEDKIQLMSEKNPNVIWLGHVSDEAELDSLWSSAGAYFHGHSVGGTNPALVQAMYCGAPIVARDTVYNREVLGSAGKFVNPNSNEIYSAIDMLMTNLNLASDFSKSAQKRAIENYSWNQVSDSYILVLEQLVNPSKVG